MPRRHYPSDDRRRKQRPHIKVHLSIANHPTYGQVFADPFDRGVILGIWTVSARAYISRTKDELSLSNADACWITGTDRMVDAAKVLKRVCAAMNYEFRRACDMHPNCPRRDGLSSASRKQLVSNSSANGKLPMACQRPARWVVVVRNFSRKQGFTPHSATDSDGECVDSATSESEEPRNRDYAPRSDDEKTEEEPRRPGPWGYKLSEANGAGHKPVEPVEQDQSDYDEDVKAELKRANMPTERKREER